MEKKKFPHKFSIVFLIDRKSILRLNERQKNKTIGFGGLIFSRDEKEKGLDDHSGSYCFIRKFIDEDDTASKAVFIVAVVKQR
jgi:hypothetical protein